MMMLVILCEFIQKSIPLPERISCAVFDERQAKSFGFGTVLPRAANSDGGRNINNAL